MTLPAGTLIQDQLNWLQLHDSNDIESSSGKYYDIASNLTKILLDKDGLVIRFDLPIKEIVKIVKMKLYKMLYLK